MGFTEAVKTVFSKYATFSGRATRSEYWWFQLFNIIMIYGSLLIFLPLGLMFNIEWLCWGPWVILACCYSLAAFIPSLAVTIRRLHDTNLSGWNFLWALIPYVGGLIVFVLVLQGSFPAENEYGPYEA